MINYRKLNNHAKEVSKKKNHNNESKSKHRVWIHRKFLTRVVGDKILPDDPAAVMA